MQSRLSSRLFELTIEDMFSALSSINKWTSEGIREAISYLDIQERNYRTSKQVESVVIGTIVSKKVNANNKCDRYITFFNSGNLEKYQEDWIVNEIMRMKDIGNTGRTLQSIVAETGFCNKISVVAGGAEFSLTVCGDSEDYSDIAYAIMKLKKAMISNENSIAVDTRAIYVGIEVSKENSNVALTAVNEILEFASLMGEQAKSNE